MTHTHAKDQGQRSSRNGVVLVAQTAIRFLTLPYLKGHAV